MKVIKGGFVVLFALFVVGIVVYDIATSKAVIRRKTIKITLPIVTTGDTAQVTKITPQLVIDSFTYSDSFSYQPDTTAHQTIEWTSPLQVGRITPTADAATVYSCSVAFAAQTLGFDVDPDAGYTTVAKICDTITYLFENTANLTDSITAEDSTTYVKIISLFGQRKFTARWAIAYGVTGGAGTMDTTSNGGSDITSLAMICDSMVASINDDVGLDSFLTAYDSATFYITQSDDPGVLFLDTPINHADTHGTWTASQANVTSWSGVNDTVDLEKLITDGLYPDVNYGGIKLRCYVDSVHDVSVQGVGLADSFYIKILSGFSMFSDLGGKVWDFRVLANDSFSELPDSLHYALTDASGTDTVLGEVLKLVYRVSDSASDSTMSVDHRLYIDYWLFEDK